MFPLFFRGRRASAPTSSEERADQRFRRRQHRLFRARTPERDSQTDQERVSAVARAIENAIVSATAEQNGLKRRIDDVLLRASMSVGSDVDEYLHREKSDADALNAMDQDIANGQRRILELAKTIDHLKSVQSVMLSHFPDHASQGRT